MMLQEIKSIDFDFWCNAKKEIIIALYESGSIESISEMARIIDRTFSVTYRHLSSLKEKGYINIQKSNKNNVMIINLYDSKLLPKDIFTNANA